MAKRKTEVISFKVDETLARAMHGIENRSAFIRAAVASALEGRCPLCGGTGRLSANQMRHWQDLKADHPLVECEHCRELRITCSNRKT